MELVALASYFAAVVVLVPTDSSVLNDDFSTTSDISVNVVFFTLSRILDGLNSSGFDCPAH